MERFNGLPYLETKKLAKTIYYYPEINSTQLEIWRKVEANEIENGTLVIADKQTNGMRNSW